MEMRTLILLKGGAGVCPGCCGVNIGSWRMAGLNISASWALNDVEVIGDGADGRLWDPS